MASQMQVGASVAGCEVPCPAQTQHVACVTHNVLLLPCAPTEAEELRKNWGLNEVGVKL